MDKTGTAPVGTGCEGEVEAHVERVGNAGLSRRLGVHGGRPSPPELIGPGEFGGSGSGVLSDEVPYVPRVPRRFLPRVAPAERRRVGSAVGGPERLRSTWGPR